MALQYAGRTAEVGGLIEAFDSHDHFKTYEGERNASFSANCNVLICLLMLDESSSISYASQISKAANFVCMEAFKGTVREKWVSYHDFSNMLEANSMVVKHRHELYWKMLLSQALALLCDTVRHEALREAVLNQNPLLEEYIPMVSLHILVQILESQHTDGAWDGMCEVTAYAVLSLSSMSRLPWVRASVHYSRVTNSIAKGKGYLGTNRDEWKKGRHLWIEKVTYASDVLCEAYCIAGAAATVASAVDDLPSSHKFALPDHIIRDVRKSRRMLEGTGMQWKPGALDIAEQQACYALRGLQRRRLEIFPEAATGKDRYLAMTALIWMACDTLHHSSLSLSDLHEMMVLSMFIYQIDQYVEFIIEQEYGEDLPLVETLIRQLCFETRSVHDGSRSFQERPAASSPAGLASGEGKLLHDVSTVLGRFIGYILQHPAVVGRSIDLQGRIALELETFLLAHLAHAADNRRYRSQKDGDPLSPANNDNVKATPNLPREYRNPGRTFYTWVRGTSANHTSCPAAFAFFNCLVTKTPHDTIFSAPRTAYITEDVCRHLSSMCRMYNDYGSLKRDMDELNLNSLNFPEFHHRSRSSSQGSSRDTLGALQESRYELMQIAEYERSGLNFSVVQLENILGKGHLMEALKLFIDVTDMYGLVYLVKDLTNRAA